MPDNAGFTAVKPVIAKYWFYYTIGLIVCFGLKYFYSTAGSDDLAWILTPTAWWVSLLSGIPFERVRNVGFVNHAVRFVIAPACSGINFLIIVFASLLFAFLHKMKKVLNRFLWIAASLVSAFLLTILVNGFRIVVSIYLLRLDIYDGWLTFDRVHMIEGTMIYFVSLIVIYRFTGELLKCRTRGGFIPPLVCYFSVTLGIPLLNRAFFKDGAKFVEHAVLVIGVCLVVILLLYLTLFLRRNVLKLRNRHLKT